MTGDVKPYTVVPLFPGEAMVLDRETGNEVGYVASWGEFIHRWDARLDMSDGQLVGDASTRSEAAALVWEAHQAREAGK